MDPSRFDTLTRVLAQVGNRRGVMGLLAALPLGGVLTGLGADEAAAERPGDRLQRRSRRRNQKQRNSKRNKNQNHKSRKNNGKGLGANQCGATDSDCTQDSDCCSANCFDFACADRVKVCGEGSTAKRCLPPAKGCAGDTCCYGPLACGDTCCEAPANQCNLGGECCVPNCAGRSCGPDGCGTGGTCGTCPTGSTCNEMTGQCSCNPLNCPNGCCDAAGTCQTGDTDQVCGTGGAACVQCSKPETGCSAGKCVNLGNKLTCHCNNGTERTVCTPNACGQDTVRALCPVVCNGDGGWNLAVECIDYACVLGDE